MDSDSFFVTHHASFITHHPLQKNCSALKAGAKVDILFLITKYFEKFFLEKNHFFVRDSFKRIVSNGLNE